MPKNTERLVNPKLSVFLFNEDNPKGQVFNFENGKQSPEYKKMLRDGWVDTPKRLNLPVDDKTGVTLEQATDANPVQLVELVKALGFIVLTPDQMKAEIQKMTNVILNIEKFGDLEFIAEAHRRKLHDLVPEVVSEQLQQYIELHSADHYEQPTTTNEIAMNDEDARVRAIFEVDAESLTKQELIAFGNKFYQLNLNLRMKEATLISAIEKAITWK